MSSLLLLARRGRGVGRVVGVSRDQGQTVDAIVGLGAIALSTIGGAYFWREHRIWGGILGFFVVGPIVGGTVLNAIDDIKFSPVRKKTLALPPPRSDDGRESAGAISDAPLAVADAHRSQK